MLSSGGARQRLCNHWRSFARIAAITLVATATVAKPASAVLFTWEGDVSTAYGTAGNWSNNAVPVSSDTALFPGSATGFTVALGGNRTLAGAEFDSDPIT